MIVLTLKMIAIMIMTIVIMMMRMRMRTVLMMSTVTTHNLIHPRILLTSKAINQFDLSNIKE